MLATWIDAEGATVGADFTVLVVARTDPWGVWKHATTVTCVDAGCDDVVGAASTNQQRARPRQPRVQRTAGRHSIQMLSITTAVS